MIEDFEPEEKAIVFRLLSHDMAIEVFEELGLESQTQLIHSLANERVAALLEEMAPDERTQLLEELPSKITRRLINLLSPEERRVASRLLGYPEDSAGRLMTPDLVWVRDNATVAHALKKIRRFGKEAETINLIYVIDAQKRPIGVVSLADLVLNPTQTHISGIMKELPATVSANADKEEAAALCGKYELLAVPVVNPQGQLIGIVTIDDLVEVIEEEATEDIHVMAGVVPPERDYLDISMIEMWWRRVIWLLVLAVIELGAGFVLRHNTTFIEQFFTLAIFITVMTATGGSCGTQSATMVIRAMAIGALEFKDFRRVAVRETATGALLGSTVGLAMFIVACLVQIGDINWLISITVGISLGAILTISNMLGAFLPLLFGRLKLDPALMAGPFITTIVDVFGLLLYFEIARFALAALWQTA
ncbi:MAG: Magnesium transporter MgtE [candidate division BRC1 bacterium ADurb.BinA364]|nr:MAG: Magnesium transporter MgtE [candidate division BRC1 bacterium ADurb.BinA364]